MYSLTLLCFNDPWSGLHFLIFHSPLDLPWNSVVGGVHFQLRRASYKEKGKSGVALKILSYFPNTDARRSIRPAKTDAKRRRRLTSPLPRPWCALECPLSAHSKAGQSKGATNCCPAEGRAARPGCGCLVLLYPWEALLLRRNSDLGRNSAVVMCHQCAATDREAGGVC